MSTEMHAWVANTIQNLGGNAAQYLQGIQREQVLTFTASRADACQVAKPFSGKVFSLDAARCLVRVTAHKRDFSEKRHGHSHYWLPDSQ